MFGKKKRAPQPRGQGAAAAKQMGLFVDLDPEEMMMGMEGSVDDPDLEAELAAITGSKAPAGGRAKQKGKSPLHMEDIARMADECMKDDDEDDDDSNLEDDEDLLAELQEVVGEEEDEDVVPVSSTPSATASQAERTEPTQPDVKAPPAAPGSLQHTLEERVGMYKTALQHAKTAGETSKVRRYDRGLKTLQSMLAGIKKGRPVNEAEIPPPVATGAPSADSQPAVPHRPAPPVPSPPEPTSSDQQGESEATPPVPEVLTPSSEEEHSSSATLSPLSTAPSPEEQTSPTDANELTKTLLLERQKEYKMAALRAKKQGDVEQARLHFMTSKRFDVVIEALEKGEAVDLGGLPPSPQAAAPTSAPSAPRDVLEALEQRRAKYLEASNQAKASGDDRKARMHDRIAKQYQSAIRAHKAGKAVNFEELPVPHGFPPIPGQKATGAEQGFIAALEAADKLSSTDDAEIGNEEDDEEEPAAPEGPKKPLLDVPPAGQGKKRTPSASPDRTATREGLSPSAAQQLEFLEGRRRQYMKAALQAKQRGDMEQAKTFLRTAKGFEPMIEAARGGRSVDISAVPSPPGDEDEDFILVHHSDVQISEKAEQLYTQLAKILKEQHEKCMTHSKQFTHLGNVTETTRFEKMAESCKKSLEVLKLAQSRGLPPPLHHFEERSFHTVRIFPDLSSSDLVVIIVKGINLPAPSGIQTNDLDAFVKFDFPYPSAEQPQRHKTAVIKNTNAPAGAAAQRCCRVETVAVTLAFLSSGFLRSDKPIGTALVKLEKLESQSEIREIVEASDGEQERETERSGGGTSVRYGRGSGIKVRVTCVRPQVMDGRKATGGRVEVKIRLREPLSGQDMQKSTERWLVIDQSQVNGAHTKPLRPEFGM
ncbi:Coiled-coil and C2 domain-containing protein 1B [Liparis tanakae]|uniref:Coiled-coil and C2 domain-containing protein 1B n=1 Tax=Liparis tanakae TaxID=230148 RepID=A0A4Z2JEQ9_9TELE|nr:Coiled-coil and C2 domain-containing protein 1B [Liparis tanakae]